MRRLHDYGICTALALVCAATLLCLPAARDVLSCRRAAARMPAVSSTVRLLADLPGLAAVESLIVVDGRMGADRFALHAVDARSARALGAAAVDASGARFAPAPSSRARKAISGAQPPDWRLDVRDASACPLVLDRKRGVTHTSEPPTLVGGLSLVCHDSAIAVAHYFHVIEHLLALWALQRTFAPGRTAERLLVTGGRTRDVDISPDAPKGRLMRQLVGALFPNATVVRPSDWSRTTRRTGAPVVLETALVSSRMTCHRNRKSSGLNKMLAAHADAIRPHAPSFRDALLRGLGVDLPPKAELRARGGGAARRLKVGIVDRGGSNRRLDSKFKAALLAAFQADARFSASLLRFQDFPYVEQVRMAAELDVMVGCHGNGLTHAMLMRPPAVMIELFPASINFADYQLHADYAGHRHFGWSDRQGLLVQSPHVVRCAERYGIYAHYGRKSDMAVFVGHGGNRTLALLLRLAHDLALASEAGWRELIWPSKQVLEECERPDPPVLVDPR
jgi:hypothetical protein